jgi:hypothetical protein
VRREALLRNVCKKNIILTQLYIQLMADSGSPPATDLATMSTDDADSEGFSILFYLPFFVGEKLNSLRLLSNRKWRSIFKCSS